MGSLGFDVSGKIHAEETVGRRGLRDCADKRKRRSLRTTFCVWPPCTYFGVQALMFMSGPRSYGGGT